MAQVLVVDDEPDITRFLREALTRHGYTVSVAADGDEALRVIDQNPIDIVVLDLMLPGLDGFEVLQQLAHRDEGPQIVVLSAIGDIRCRVRCLTMGAADYLPSRSPSKNSSPGSRRGCATTHAEPTDTGFTSEP